MNTLAKILSLVIALNCNGAFAGRYAEAVQRFKEIHAANLAHAQTLFRGEYLRIYYELGAAREARIDTIEENLDDPLYAKFASELRRELELLVFESFDSNDITAVKEVINWGRI